MCSRSQWRTNEKLVDKKSVGSGWCRVALGKRQAPGSNVV